MKAENSLVLFVSPHADPALLLLIFDCLFTRLASPLLGVPLRLSKFVSQLFLAASGTLQLPLQFVAFCAHPPFAPA
eukprot:3675746-Pyramimonas_sp.AAC.1